MPGSLVFSAGVTPVDTSQEPEPETWVLMLAGTGLVGAGLRLGRRPVGGLTRA